MRTLASHWSCAIIIPATVLFMSVGAGLAGFMMAPDLPKKVPPPPNQRRVMNCATGIVMTQNDKDRFWAGCLITAYTSGLTMIGFTVGTVTGIVLPWMIRID